MLNFAVASSSSAVLGLVPLAGLTTVKRSASLSSGFVRSASTIVRNPLRQQCQASSGGRFICFQRDWLRKDLNVIGFALIGWLAPSSIPALNGSSLTGLFFQSIGSELSKFPVPPNIHNPFWEYLLWWHLGLFLCLFFGQIGFKGRADGYF